MAEVLNEIQFISCSLYSLCYLCPTLEVIPCTLGHEDTLSLSSGSFRLLPFQFIATLLLEFSFETNVS